MFGTTKVEKFEKTNREARKEMKGTGRVDQRKRNKTKRGKDNWAEVESY
jgi:hypothetical protein